MLIRIRGGVQGTLPIPFSQQVSFSSRRVKLTFAGLPLLPHLDGELEMPQVGGGVLQ